MSSPKKPPTNPNNNPDQEKPNNLISPLAKLFLNFAAKANKKAPTAKTNKNISLKIPANNTSLNMLPELEPESPLPEEEDILPLKTPKNLYLSRAEKSAVSLISHKSKEEENKHKKLLGVFAQIMKVNLHKKDN
jgi:hypothetical protein